MVWDAANARARGLATHLLSRESLLAAVEAGSWQAGIRALSARGYPVTEGGAPVTPAEFDRVAGRVLTGRFALLGRWLGKRREALAILYERQDYLALRKLLRGAAEGAPPGARLRGILPTPGLPERALGVLARTDSPGRLADALIRLGHPAGRALQAAGAAQADGALWRLETALARLFALRATRAARGAGRAVRRFAAALIDLQNAGALLLADGWGEAATTEDVFLAGGLLLDRARFAAIAAGPEAARATALAALFSGTSLASAFEQGSGPATFEGRALMALRAWQEGEARRDPLGPGVLLEVLLRIEAEAHDVRLASGAAELGAPAGVIAAALVTPA